MCSQAGRGGPTQCNTVSFIIIVIILVQSSASSTTQAGAQLLQLLPLCWLPLFGLAWYGMRHGKLGGLAC